MKCVANMVICSYSVSIKQMFLINLKPSFDLICSVRSCVLASSYWILGSNSLVLSNLFGQISLEILRSSYKLIYGFCMC